MLAVARGELGPARHLERDVVHRDGIAEALRDVRQSQVRNVSHRGIR